MPVFKNEDNGTWYVMARYVNWKGERKQKCKRGLSESPQNGLDYVFLGCCVAFHHDVELCIDFHFFIDTTRQSDRRT